MGLRVVLEVAPKRTFASALDWPGWSRAGRTSDEALDALLAYGPRYAEVARRAKVAFPPPATFDAAAAGAAGTTLRLGPRGGGRQVPKIIDHVREAESAYLAQLGSRLPNASELHDAFADAVTARAAGEPVAQPNQVRKLWSPRYAVRRAAWHVLDHAWEIEDRAS